MVMDVLQSTHNTSTYHTSQKPWAYKMTMMINGLLLGCWCATWVITDDDGYLHNDWVIAWAMSMDDCLGIIPQKWRSNDGSWTVTQTMTMEDNLMMDHELLWWCLHRMRWLRTIAMPQWWSMKPWIGGKTLCAPTTTTPWWWSILLTKNETMNKRKNYYVNLP
jgi:hypothetical protein